MLKLRDVRARDIHQRSVGVYEAVRDQRPHPEVVVLHPRDTFQVPPGEDQGPEILVDGLEQRLRGGVMKARRGGTDVLVAPVAVHAHVVPGVAFAGAAEGFDGEDVAFLHALADSGFHEGDLLVAVDAVAQDVVTGDVPDGFHGDGLPAEGDFVAFHHFLDGRADVVHSGVDAGFLGAGFFCG